MKKTLYLDIERCTGCGACVVACMDQNDIYPEKGQSTFIKFYQIEDGEFPDSVIRHIAIACMHCEDSPCAIACPTGAITRATNTGAVTVRRELCIGCHSCALACPFGVPRYDMEDKMVKCNLCTERVEYGLQPACVKVCPVQALRFEPINAIQDEKQLNYAVRTVHGISSATPS